MTKKRLIIISSVVAVVIVVMGLLASTVFAETPTLTTGTATSPQSVLMARVAGILGIDQAKVEAAFTQAQQEIRSDAEAARLAKLVADGKLTQEQADQYKAWLDSKPSIPGLVGPQGGRGGMMGGGMIGREFRCAPGNLGGRGLNTNVPAVTPTTTN